MENMKTIVKNVTFIRRYDTVIPTLEIRYDDKVAYLSPFRGQCFQVSATDEGERDMGRSISVNIKKLTDNELFAYAQLALFAYANTRYGAKFRDHIFDLNINYSFGPLREWIDNDVRGWISGSIVYPSL